MEDKEHKIWFDILMYTVLMVCITYLIYHNQMQRYFIYIIVVGYVLATTFKVAELVNLKQNNDKKESKNHTAK